MPCFVICIQALVPNTTMQPVQGVDIIQPAFTAVQLDMLCNLSATAQGFQFEAEDPTEPCTVPSKD